MVQEIYIESSYVLAAMEELGIMGQKIEALNESFARAVHGLDAPVRLTPSVSAILTLIEKELEALVEAMPLYKEFMGDVVESYAVVEQATEEELAAIADLEQVHVSAGFSAGAAGGGAMHASGGGGGGSPIIPGGVAATAVSGMAGSAAASVETVEHVLTGESESPASSVEAGKAVKFDEPEKPAASGNPKELEVPGAGKQENFISEAMEAAGESMGAPGDAMGALDEAVGSATRVKLPRVESIMKPFAQFAPDSPFGKAYAALVGNFGKIASGAGVGVTGLAVYSVVMGMLAVHSGPSYSLAAAGSGGRADAKSTGLAEREPGVVREVRFTQAEISKMFAEINGYGVLDLEGVSNLGSVKPVRLGAASSALIAVDASEEAAFALKRTEEEQREMNVITWVWGSEARKYANGFHGLRVWPGSAGAHPGDGWFIATNALVITSPQNKGDAINDGVAPGANAVSFVNDAVNVSFASITG